MKRLLWLVPLLLLLATGADAAKIRAYTALTGGGTGALDKTSVGVLGTNDLSFVYDVSTKTVYFYYYDSTATDAETSPHIIRPDDYSTGGNHLLMSSFAFGRSATPQTIYRDSDNTDYDNNVVWNINCTDTGSGTEDCDINLQIQVAGTLTTVMSFDADGSVTVGTAAVPLVIPNGTNPANTTEAAIQWDSDNDMLIVGDGSAALPIATKTHCFATATFYQPDALDASTEPGGGVFPVAHVDQGNFPGGFTVTRIIVASSATCTDAISMEEWSNNGSAWNEDATIDAVTMSGVSTTETTISGPGLDADDWIMVDFAATMSDVDWISITVCGTRVAID